MAPKKEINSLVYGKVPPQALETEEAVLAACMMEREAFDNVLEIIKTLNVFYSDIHQKIWEALLHLNNIGRSIDLITVTDQLRRQGDLELVGGAFHLTKLTMAVLSSAHAETHARIVVEKFKAREIIRICGSAINEAYEGATDVFDLIDNTEKSIQQISQATAISNFVPVGETYAEILMDIEEAKGKPEGLSGIDTGYPEINEMTDGWQPGNLIILAARPSVGKTALALNFAINGNVPTLIFSLEANKKELVKRLASMKTDVYFSAVKKGKLSEWQENKLLQYCQYFYSLQIEIDDRTQELSSIVTAIRRKVAKKGIKIVYIDYAQLIRATRDKNSNREQEIASITRTLKLLASELQITIVALAQLNRDVEKTTTKRPQLSNLRESGAFEQDANIVMMIWRQEMENNQSKHIICIEKNRDGKCGDVELKFNGDLQKWETITPDMNQQKPDKPNAGFENRYKYDDDAPF
jgi:replicative DNA helicase